MTNNSDESIQKEGSHQKPDSHIGFVQLVISVLGAAIGVQSSKRRVQDFQSGKPIVFIIAGIVFTLLFIIILSIIVKLVLLKAGI